MDTAFITMLYLASFIGFTLLLRATCTHSARLAIHLRVVLARFLTLSYGKVVHNLRRHAALARFTQERQALSLTADTAEA